MKPLLRVLVLLLVLAHSLPALAVELTGQIRGRTLDEDGGPIPGVVIRVTSPNLQGERLVETDANGEFRVVGLPPGSYRVEASLPGFNTWVASDVRVAAGSTVTLEIAMTLAEAGEVMVVEAEAPVVDVERTRTGVTLSSDFLKDLPNPGRDYQSAIAVAPGVVGGGNANVHGGFDTSNQFYIDGVNTTDPLTNTFSLNMNYDAIEEIQVITGGMDAEYGESLGGAFNIVTKSGGNEYEAQLDVHFANQAMQFYTPLEVDDPYGGDFQDLQAALNVGGPVIQDKLWFFVSLQYNRYISTTVSDVDRPEGPDPITGQEMSEIPPRDWRSFYWFGKLTWQPNQANRLWIHAQGDPTRIDNENQDPYGLPSSEWGRFQGGWLTSVGHLFTPRHDLSLETQAYYQKSVLDVRPMLWWECTDWADDGITCLDYPDKPPEGWPSGWLSDTGFAFGDPGYAYYTQRNRMSFNTKLTWYVQDLFGDHAFKAGFDAEKLSSYSIYPGELELEVWNPTGDPTDLASYAPSYKVVYDNNWEADLDGTRATWFVQDVWTLWDRLTLRPGVRFDWTRLKNEVGDVVFQSLVAAPRFGGSLDLLGDQTTAIHAFYGRFYDPGYLAVADLLTTFNTGYSVYYWDDQAGDWATDPAYSVFGNFLVADDLKNPRSDEWNVGLTRQISPWSSLDITYVHKYATNFWEDDEVNLIWNEDGSEVIGYRNGVSEAIYRLRTPDDVWVRYDSVEVSLNKMWSDNWGTTASYTWSKAYGTNSADVATAGFDIPEQAPYEVGYLSYDRTHAVKVVGSYRNPAAFDLGTTRGGYLLGWDLRVYSGTPYRDLYYNDYYSAWSNYGDDGDTPHRYEVYSQLNLKGGFTFDVGPTTWALTAEVFNVFDKRAVTAIDNRYEDPTGENDIYPDYGTPLSYQDPRYFSIGLRGEF